MECKWLCFTLIIQKICSRIVLLQNTEYIFFLFTVDCFPFYFCLIGGFLKDGPPPNKPPPTQDYYSKGGENSNDGERLLDIPRCLA